MDLGTGKSKDGVWTGSCVCLILRSMAIERIDGGMDESKLGVKLGCHRRHSRPNFQVEEGRHGAGIHPQYKIPSYKLRTSRAGPRRYLRSGSPTLAQDSIPLHQCPEMHRPIACMPFCTVLGVILCTRGCSGNTIIITQPSMAAQGRRSPEPPRPSTG